jgi:hypothetical protein
LTWDYTPPTQQLQTLSTSRFATLVRILDDALEDFERTRAFQGVSVPGQNKDKPADAVADPKLLEWEIASFFGEMHESARDRAQRAFTLLERIHQYQKDDGGNGPDIDG